jgi:hypothetical protein
VTPDPEKREYAEDLAEALKRNLLLAYQRVSQDEAALRALEASSQPSLSWADHEDTSTSAYFQGVQSFGGANDLAPLVHAAMAGLLVQQEAARARLLWDQLEAVAEAELAAIW